VNSDALPKDEEGDEMETPMKEELIEAATRADFSVQDLAQGEIEIAVEKVSFTSPSSAKFRCPILSKIIKAIVRGISLKHYGKPWQGSLPQPSISLPHTLGDAVVKNSFIRLRGGPLQPKLFKMALPSMIDGSREASSPVTQKDQGKVWPPLPSLAAS
jgi:hypothetical protein